MPGSEQYLMDLLGFKSRKKLIDFLNQPDHPTGNMHPPAVYEFPDEEVNCLTNPPAREAHMPTGSVPAQCAVMESPGDQMRAILKAAHECFIPRWNGPMYVKPYRHWFVIRGFGWNENAPHFAVHRGLSGAWIFEVMP